MTNKLRKFDINKDSILKALGKNIIVVLLLIMVLYVGFTRENFLSIANLQNVARNVSLRLIMALGVSGCLITRGTDLSASRIPAIAGCLAASVLQRPGYASSFFKSLPKLPIIGDYYPTWLVLAVLLIVVAFCGLINGLLIAYLKIPPFIATLGTQQIIYGCLRLFTRNQNIGALRPDYTVLATGKLLGIPYLFVIVFIVGLLMWFLYNMTRHGKYMYAIGGNEVAAEVSGINVQFTLVRIYVLAACLYGLGGFLSVAKAGSASVDMAVGWELEAIAACTIGGVSTAGGVGKISGIVIGVMVFELMKSSINFLGISPNYQPIIIGAVMLISIAFDIRNTIAKK